MARIFTDRYEAGLALAPLLQPYVADDPLVLGLPRGGVPVAWEVAHVLNAPLDIYLVRKLGVPGHTELAMGAIASGGVRVLNHQFITQFGVPDHLVREVTRRERHELERQERAFRGDRPEPALTGRTIIVVDDGLATGSTMLAAVSALRTGHPAHITVAVPVGAADSCAELKLVADDCICATTPEPFYGVGDWYLDFTQTTDDEVRALLQDAGRPPSGAARGGASRGAW